MKLIVEEAVNNLVEVEKITSILHIADFDVGLRQMLEANQSQTVTATSDITLTDDDVILQFIECSGSDINVYLPTPSINNHGFVILNISDASYVISVWSGGDNLGDISPAGGIGWFVSNGIEWVNAGGQSGAGAGGEVAQSLFNRSGSSVVKGDVLIIDINHNKSFTTTEAVGDRRVLGVANATIENDEEGSINTVGGVVVQVNCTSSAVSVGHYLIASATKGKAQAAGYFRVPAAFAVALTSKSAGSAGAVDAMLIQDIKLTIGGGVGWSMGGYTGAVTDNVQKLTMAVGTWATIAGAALPTAVDYNGGLGATTIKAYSIGGLNAANNNTATAQVLTYSSETTSLVASANLGTARHQLSNGVSGNDKGWIAGGNTGSIVNITDLITYATDTRSAGQNLGAASCTDAGISDATTAYSNGSAGKCSKYIFATDAISAHPDGDITDTYGYISLSFPASSGYWAYKAGANNYAFEIPFATGVKANGNQLASDQAYSAGSTDGLYVGYASGDDASPYSKMSKFTLSTETWADDTAAMDLGKFASAWASFGTY